MRIAAQVEVDVDDLGLLCHAVHKGVHVGHIGAHALEPAVECLVVGLLLRTEAPLQIPAAVDKEAGIAALRLGR